MANSAVSSGILMFSLRQDERISFAVQREAEGAVADGDDELRGRAVDREAGGDLVAPGLQEALLVGHHDSRPALGAAQHREDGAHRDVDVDVGGAVQRVEQQQVLAARVVRRRRLHVLHLLRDQRGEVAAPFVGLAAGSRSTSRRGSSASRPARSRCRRCRGRRPAAPLLTRVLIALQARAMVSISRRRSALMRPARWRSMRNCVREVRRMAGFYPRIRPAACRRASCRRAARRPWSRGSAPCRARCPPRRRRAA